MFFTSNSEKILAQLVGSENFIAIGELHNSRAAIKFILDNLERLLPAGRNVYFLTEFLPTGFVLKANAGNKGSYLRAKLKLAESDRKRLTADLQQREGDKVSDDQYTLEELYKLLFPRCIQLVSVEHQDGSSADLYRRIQQGEFLAFQERVDQINQIAAVEADKILKSDPSALVLLFAGMGHTADSAYYKPDDQGGYSSVVCKGVDTLLKERGYLGKSISVLDPDLCDDNNVLQAVDVVSPCFTKLAKADSYLTIDRPDAVLFLNTPAKCAKVKRDQFESLFLPGEHRNPNEVKEAAYRNKIFQEVPVEAVPAKKKKKKKKKKAAEVEAGAAGMEPSLSDGPGDFMEGDQPRLGVGNFSGNSGQFPPPVKGGDVVPMDGDLKPPEFGSK